MYSIITPLSSYSPWLADREFISIYQQIKSHTIVDPYRLYELWHLAKQTQHVTGDIIEVGVWRGGSGCLLAAATNKQVYLCDTFTGVVKASGHDTTYRNGEHADTSVAAVLDLISSLPIFNVHLRVGVFPDETGFTITNTKFSLAHIDVDTHDSARDSFAFIWPRLSVGGVVVFDDYGFSTCSGITEFVNGLRVGLMIYNLNGHAVVVKTKT